MRRSFFKAVLAAVAFVGSASADVITMAPSADTTLIELVPDNNMGGHPFFNAGSTLHGSRNRGLLHFDVAADIPAGSIIKSTELVVWVVGIPTDEPEGGNFRLYRMLRPWGEGQKLSVVGPGRGDLATTNEATWNHRFAFTTNIWNTPGGTGGTDFLSAYSGEMFIEAVNNLPYTFGSSSNMIEDVQLWLDVPASNFGWLMKIEDEAARTTARRFASREDVDKGPKLIVEFDPPPLLIVDRFGSDLRISFITRPNESYVFQNAESTTASWNSISNIAAEATSRTVRLTNSISGATGFFRLLVEP